ncbi:CIC11C00000001798 [Sungouiella intermedia]|uniref:Exocyst complex component EXO84 n=1 Tax=Sungouiella intermedia TaxID=45354 RepID=A0A1L0DHL9_9ASCO|nr:CIC11C00000001798 [[Candida] intermedia]
MDTKANRKSRAPWQHQRARGVSNPYADATSIVETQDPNSNTLQVPKTAASKSRRQTRRLSIHASAMAPQNMFDAGNLPPLPGAPGMYRTATNNSDMVSVRSQLREKKEEDIVDIIKTELRDKDATAIDDFYKSLVGQKQTLDRDIKDKINQNQRNILQLTDNLQITQEELMLLRVQTKELYGILAEFTDAAERRIELEEKEAKNVVGASGATSSGSSLQLRLPKKKRDRLSVMVLQKMWVLELQLLYKHVDGAQKFVQPIPGRHIVGESGRWHEINIGTWKPTKPIHLFLLNDAVLVATRKLAQDGNSKRLQAVYCWPLLQVNISEIQPPAQANKGRDDKMYVINVRFNSMSYVYQTDRYDHFMRVMNAYTKGKTEIMQKERLIEEETSKPSSHEMGHHRNASAGSLADEYTDKRQLRDSLRNSGLMGLPLPSTEDVTRRPNSQRQSADILLKDISARVHQRNRSHDFAKIERSGSRSDNLPARLFSDLKTCEDKLDEVDVHLAHNEYMSAVGLLNHIDTKVAEVGERISLTKGDNNAKDELRLLVDVVKIKINARRVKVKQGLQFVMHHSIAGLLAQNIGEIIEYYLSFGKLDEGIMVFLDAMSNHLSQTVGKFISNDHGSTRVDIVNYLANLTIVYVLIVKRAVTIHKTCIEPIMKRDSGSTDSSGFVTWSVSQISQLVESIERHASGTLLVKNSNEWQVKDPKYYKELVSVIEPQLAQLKREGLNVDYLFDDILHCRPIAAFAQKDK